MTSSRNDKYQDNKNTDNKKSASSSQEKGKQGFASMPKEQVRKIAAEGGKHSHDNTNKKER